MRPRASGTSWRRPGPGGLNTEVLDVVKGIAGRTIAAGHGNAGCVSVIEEMRRSSAKA
ncbi:hypothetical protein [Streptomyces sp. MOE7]|uniref:hypothetical protein n=1 Tax=Streptomyces sp. MOE7 TaxID=1961713 RepID=UPI0013148D5D|nr:hypothetical protein [Streptomyces sp. MOE7]